MARLQGSSGLTRFGRCLLALVLFSQSACAGKVSGSGATGDPQGGVSSGGAATGGAASEAPLFALERFPWFDASGAIRLPGDEPGEGLHWVLDEVPARGTLSTHNHIALLSGRSAVRFSARASAPFRLLVSASASIPSSYDYFAARDAGMSWPVASVDVALDRQDFSVLLADMRPPDASPGCGGPCFFLAFIVEHPGPIEVWLDAVRFE